MVENGISENFSKNSPQKKRGRPATFAFDLGWTASADALLGREQTSRGKNNMRFALLGCQALLSDPSGSERYAWLVRGDAPAVSRTAIKRTIMTELGRIAWCYGDETARTVALDLCARQPKTREAVQALRARRLHKSDAAGQTDALEEAITRAIEDYLTRYPATDGDQIVTALENALGLWICLTEKTP